MTGHRRALWLPLVCLLVSACAPGSSTSSPAPAKPAAAADPAAGAPGAAPTGTALLERFVYGMVSYNPLHTVVMVATEKRLMEQYGVDAEIILTGSSPAAVAALVGGSLDMVTATMDAGFTVQAQNPDVKALLGVAVGAPYALIVSPDIAAIANLRGQTLGATALKTGADSVSLRTMLGKHGLVDDRDYTIVVVGSVAERAAAMRAGAVAAVLNLEPQVSELKAQGFKVLDALKNYPELRNMYSVIAAGRQSAYQARADVFVKFMKAYIAGIRFVNDPANREEVIEILGKLLKMDREYAANAYSDFVLGNVFPGGLAIETEGLLYTVQNARALEVPGVPDNPQTAIDNSLADRATREMGR